MLHPDDPSIHEAAEAAARRFETEELDRWLRIHSFVHRHGEGFFLVSCVIMLIGVFGVMLTTNNLALEHGPTPLDWALLLLAMVGAQMMAFVQIRPSTRSWTGAVVKVTGILVALAIAITIPALVVIAVLQSL